VTQDFGVANPTATGVTPGSVGRGAISFPVSVTGTGLTPTSTVSVSGTGVTVATTYVSSTQLDITVTVASNATLGSRDVTVDVPGAPAAVCTGCLSIALAPYGLAPLPTNLGRGALNETIGIVGINFQPGTWDPTSVLFSGTGITVNSVTRVNTLLLSVNVTVDPSAPLGARSVTVVNPDGGRGTALAAFTVNAAPSISSLSPSNRGQGATNQSVVVNGSNFRAGVWTASSVWFEGTGITVNSVTRNSTSKLTLNLSVAPDAAIGPRDVFLRNTDGGRTTRVDGFTVNQGPVVSTLTPSSLGQGASSQVITIDGAGFSTGSWSTSTVTFSGSGISVSSVTRVSANQLKATVSVASNAAVGARTVTVRNPSDNGTTTAAFTVNPRPTITSLSPSSRNRGLSNQVILVNGTGFVDGAGVAFSGNGITVNSVTWVSATQLSVNISISGSATRSQRNVTVTNPDKGTFTRSNGFRVT
jgi:hypothetical protein